MEVKKVVVRLNIQDHKDKQKALKAVSSLPGINSVEADINTNRMTVIGEVDPVDVICKLKKQWNAQLVTVGPPKDEKDAKKNGDKKNGDKKDGDKKDGEEKDGKDQTPPCKPCACSCPCSCPYPYPYPYPYSYPYCPPTCYYYY